jgi:hypothetical protein
MYILGLSIHPTEDVIATVSEDQHLQIWRLPDFTVCLLYSYLYLYLYLYHLIVNHLILNININFIYISIG